jgi:hypothetical protein
VLLLFRRIWRPEAFIKARKIALTQSPGPFSELLQGSPGPGNQPTRFPALQGDTILRGAKPPGGWYHLEVRGKHEGVLDTILRALLGEFAANPENGPGDWVSAIFWALISGGSPRPPGGTRSGYPTEIPTGIPPGHRRRTSQVHSPDPPGHPGVTLQGTPWETRGVFSRGNPCKTEHPSPFYSKGRILQNQHVRATGISLGGEVSARMPRMFPVECPRGILPWCSAISRGKTRGDDH